MRGRWWAVVVAVAGVGCTQQPAAAGSTGGRWTDRPDAPGAPPVEQEQEDPAEELRALLADCSDLLAGAEFGQHDVSVPAADLVIEEAPEQTWRTLVELDPAFTDPGAPAANSLFEPLACIDDDRPRLDGWCERHEPAWDRTARRLIGPSGHVREVTIEPYSDQGVRGIARTCARRDGLVVTARQEDEYFGDPFLEIWRLHFTAKGQPAHYDIFRRVAGQPDALLTVPFVYDAAGRLLHAPAPHGWLRREYDEHGRLRMEKRAFSDVLYRRPASTFVVWDEDATPRVRERDQYVGLGYSEAEREWLQPAGPGVLSSRSLEEFPGFVMPWSKRSEVRTDAAGREVLRWFVMRYEDGTRREGAVRTTYACKTGEVALIESASPSGWTARPRIAWEWDSATRVLRKLETRSEGVVSNEVEYRYECK